MNSVELFAGAGGLSLGLEESGWNSKCLLEWNKHACNTLRFNRDENHPLCKNWNVVEGDVRNFDYSEIIDEIDLVAGGPPCQPFSMGGKHNAQDDSRDMFPEAIRAVKELGPKYFIFENVKGLLRKSFADYFEYIICRLTFPFEGKRANENWESHFSRIKNIEENRTDCSSPYVYNVQYKLIDAADYGIPQHRHRVIIVGVREDQEWSFKFPEPTHTEDKLILSKYIDREYWKSKSIDIVDDIDSYKKLRAKASKVNQFLFGEEKDRYRTVHDAIADLPEPLTGTNTENNNHIFRGGAKPYPGHTGSQLHFPSKAVKAGTHGVPGGENMIAFQDGTYRYFTTREAARIQTFPDNYVFTGSWTESMRQIGNAVPRELGFMIGNELKSQAHKANKRKSESKLKTSNGLVTI
jgi:DNA (cytosine-5)-methyltransferase 1